MQNRFGPLLALLLTASPALAADDFTFMTS